MKSNSHWPIALLLTLSIGGMVALPLLPTYAKGAPPPTPPSDVGDHRSRLVLSPWAQMETPLPPTADPKGEGPWVVRAYYGDRQTVGDRQMVNDLAGWREPWEVHHDQGYLVVDVTHAEYDLLLDAGFRLEIDERLTARLNQPNVRLPGQTSGIPGYPCYRTVEETFATAQAIVAAHPDLATWTDVGDSWEKAEPGGSPGYDMMVLRLTNAAVPGPKPKLFIMTSAHAREYTPAELGTRFAEYLADNYGLDADVTWLLDYHEIHLLLQANPDGRKKAETGLFWRKNTNENYCSPTSNNRGADLNRNFEFQWGCCGGSSDSQCAETYRGPSAASEPETQAIQSYLRDQFPDQREDDLGAPAPTTATGALIDIHSYGELVLWPWGFIGTPAPNGAALQTLGRKFAYFNSYTPAQVIALYPADGTSDDFAYGELGLAAYTFELGTVFFQDCATFENTILPDNLPALIYAVKVARAPYLTPAGPDALDLAVDNVDQGEAAHLTATIDDTRYNNDNGTEPTQNIVAAEYYIDAPPWVTTMTPDSYPMTAVDCAFDETIEEVEATIDTTSLSAGRHLIFVRGQDTDGNWGPFTAAWLYVLGPDAPVIEGYVRQVQTNLPLSAAVETADGLRAATDPATGYYSLRVFSGTHTLSAFAATHAISTTSVVAWDTQTVRQDFDLYPLCDIFVDDVESGNAGWTAQSPWAITSQAAHTPSHCWTDSPGGNYGNNSNTSLTSPALDLSNVTGVTLRFWHTYDTEAAYDFCYVEVSTDGGGTWTTVASYDGLQPAWQEEEIPLSMLDSQADARLRFRLYSDSIFTGDGWHVDDVAVRGGGLVCLLASPRVSFVSSSPDWLGETTVFTNTTIGLSPITYTWDFGDGTPPSTEVHPTHFYTTPGRHTVVLTATNPAGNDTARADVEVYVAGVTMEPATAALAGDPGTSVTYTLRVTNTGTYTDTYSLTRLGSGWPTVCSPPCAFMLDSGAWRNVEIYVTVPTTATPGERDVAVVQVTGTGVTTTSTLTTTVSYMVYLPIIARNYR